MLDSDFWRTVAEQFAVLDKADFSRSLVANWTQKVESDEIEWRLPSGSVMSQFDPLARKGASKLYPATTTDLLVAWLNALRTESPEGDRTGVGYGLQSKSGEEHHFSFGRMNRLAMASELFCRKLESRALQKEHTKQQSVEADKSTMSSDRESIGQQIRRLRDECHWTIEELAAKMENDERSVRRHEADDVVPYGRTILKYERIFSKALKRNIVIRKMS